MHSTRNPSTSEENNNPVDEAIASGMKGASTGFAISAFGYIMSAIQLDCTKDLIPSLCEHSNKVRLNDALVFISIAEYLHECIPASLRPSRLIQDVSPTAATIIDLTATGFVAGVGLYGLFSLGKAKETDEPELAMTVPHIS